MRNLLDRYLPLRAPDGGGDGGGGAPPADPPPGGAEPPAGAPPGGSGAAPAGGAAEPYRPQGLPDTMYGNDDRETMDKMATALAGYRQRDSDRKVPDNVEAYSAFDVEQVPEAFRSHLGQIGGDPAFSAAAKIAKEEGVPVQTFQKMTTAIYQAAADAGILEQVIDPQAERASLIPESARNLSKADQDKAIDARLQENEDFIKLLMKPGADGKSKLDPKVGENALLMLMDTAAGNQFLEFMRAEMTGAGRAQPLPGDGSAPAGSSERERLREQLAAPEMQPQHPKFDRAKYEALDQEYRRVIGK